MASVWYLGRANARTITASQWATAGVAGASDTTWDATNGWSLPASSFTSAQLAILTADGAFNVAGADGPRPGSTSTPVDMSQNPITRAYFDTVNSGVQAFMKKQRLSNAPLHRQHRNERRLGPVSTDVSSTANVGSHDAALSKQVFLCPVSGVSSTQVRKATDAEYAAWPFRQYPDTGNNPRIWNFNGTAGYVLPTAATNSIDETYLHPNITMQRFELMTDAPAIEFVLYCYLGTTVSSIQAYVDGAPVTLTPQAFPGALSYYKIVFPAGKKPRLVEIVTEGVLNSINISAGNYRCWKPPKRRGPKLMVLGASYVQPFMMSSTTAGQQTFNRYGHWSQMDAHADIDQIVIDGIGGSGFVTAAPSGLGYPNNKYTDRVAGVIKAKPDVLVIADAFSNDLRNSASTASIIAAAHSFLDQVIAALPDTRIMIQTGLRTPVYGDFSTGYDTVKADLKASYGTKLYWADLRTVFDMTGGYLPSNTNGLGNTDYYIGSDGVHPTAEGGDYLRGWLYPAVQKVLWDDGTLAGTELI